MSWIRQTLLHVCPPPKVWPEQYSRLCKDHQLQLLGLVREEWVKGQVHQHEKQHKNQHRMAVRLRRFGFGFAIAGWLILVMLLASPWLAPAGTPRLASTRQPLSNPDRPPGPRPSKIPKGCALTRRSATHRFRLRIHDT
jgi:hypothetical protein